MSRALSKFREALHREILTIEQNSEARKSEIVDAVRKKLAADIKLCSKELEDMAIRQMIDRLSRRSGAVISEGPDLFGHFPGLKQSIVIPGTADERRECKRKLLVRATFAEIKLRIAANKAARAKKAEKDSPLSRLVKELEPFALNDDTTVLEAFLRAYPEAAKRSGGT